DYRFTNGNDALMPQIRELLQANVAVLVTAGAAPLQVARQATTTIPIVSALGSDPVALGFATSNAHPGGNVTGNVSAPAALRGKQVELLKEAVPPLSTVGVVWRSDAAGKRSFDDAQAAAHALGLQAVSME